MTLKLHGENLKFLTKYLGLKCVSGTCFVILYHVIFYMCCFSTEILHRFGNLASYLR